MFNTFLVQPLFNLLALIYAELPYHDFGLAIIILTVIVRLALWPLVSRQLHSQRALQALQPELSRIRTEAAGDKALEGRLTMELYKEREINPFASFLPLLIQLPIFFALYAVLQDVVKPGQIEKLAYEPIRQLAPIAQIISNKTSFHPELFSLIDLAKPAWYLAALAGLAQFIQTKQLQPKHQPDDAQAKLLQSMIYIFPFVTFFIGLSLPSALALYWVVTSAMAILQQTILLRRDVLELEAMPAGKIKGDIKQKSLGAAGSVSDAELATVTAGAVNGNTDTANENRPLSKHKKKGKKR